MKSFSKFAVSGLELTDVPDQPSDLAKSQPRAAGNSDKKPVHGQYLARPTQIAMWGHIANTLIVCASLWTDAHAWALTYWAIWSVGIAAIVLKRSAVRPRQPSLQPSARLRRRTVQYAVLLGATWSILAVGLLGTLEPRVEIILISVCVGMAASGAVVLSAIQSAALTYMSVALLPVAAKCLLFMPIGSYTGLGVLTLSYWAFLFGLVRLWSRLIESKAEAVKELKSTIEARDTIEQIAFTDPVTDLPNRRYANSVLSELQARREEKDQLPYALLYIDIDYFKVVNDTLGHAIGDLLLCAIASRLKECARTGDIVVRLGGDEFALIAFGVASKSVAEAIARRIIQTLNEPYTIGGHRISSGASLGIALSSQVGSTERSLPEFADLALYAAKAAGRGRYRCYEDEMSVQVEQRHAIDRDLRQAIAQGDLYLQYQPIFDLGSNEIVGLEALIRWRRGDQVVSPATFLPIAEENGLILPIGEWVLREACTLARSWPTGIKLAINLSAVQIYTGDIATTVARAIAETGFPADQLELEVTESVILKDYDVACEKLRDLKQLGVSLAMDDFGSGYSSLGYLTKFPFDKIKLDRSFIAGLHDGSKELGVVTAVIEMARCLGMTVTIEGIETGEQLAILARFPRVQGQGYHLSRPKDATVVQLEFARHALSIGQASQPAEGDISDKMHAA